MKDWCGTEIVVGSRVAVPVRLGASAHRAAAGIVIELSEKRARVEWHAYPIPDKGDGWGRVYGANNIMSVKPITQTGWHSPLALTVVAPHD